MNKYKLKRNNFFRISYKMRKKLRKLNKKDWMNFYVLNYFKFVLKKRLKNKELFKIPKFLKYYFSLQSWYKPKLKRRSKKYKFFVFRHKYFNRYYARNTEWKNFKNFKKDLYFWFKRRTKRQMYLLKKEFVLSNKGSKKKNYFNLKKGNLSLVYDKYKLNKRKYYIKFKKLNIIFFIYYYLKIIFNKKLFLINKLFFITINNNLFNFFKSLYKFLFLFKNLRNYLKKKFRRRLAYTDLLELKELKYIKDKWVQRKKRKRFFIYKNEKFKKRAKFFFRLKKKLFFFLNLSKIKDQFYYLKVRTVDTNFYITLTNSKHEVVIYRSTGHVSENRKKKIKLSPFTINNMIFDIIKKIKSLKIQYMIVHINSKINKNIKNVFRTIGKSVNTKLIKAEFSKPIPHHFGTRKPRPRRL